MITYDIVGTSECPLRYMMVDFDLDSNLNMRSCSTYLVSIQDFVFLISEKNVFFINCNYSECCLCEAECELAWALRGTQSVSAMYYRPVTPNHLW